MASNQGRRSQSDPKRAVNLDPILDALGRTGRYQISQLTLHILASFVYPLPILDYIFTGYQPDYQCREVENVTELVSHSPSDVTNYTLHDVTYRQCSIDVTLNSSTDASSFAFSLPCVAGINFSMPAYTSFLTEWSLVCEKAGLAQLTQSVFFGGKIVGAFVFSVLDDRYGRKKVYIACTFSLAITFIVMSFAPSYLVFLLCKFASGVFSTGMVKAGYTMFIELVPQKRRYFASFLDSTTWTFGCLLLALLAYCLQDMSWRYLFLALAPAFAFCLLLPCYLDESLRWLLATGDVDQAETILKKACRMNGKDFDKIQAILHEQISIDKTEHHDGSNPPADRKEKANAEEAPREEDPNGMNSEKVASTCTDTEETADSAGTDMQRTGDSPGNGQSASSPKGEVTPLREVLEAKYTVLDLFRNRVVFVPFLVTVSVWMTANMYYYAMMLGSANLSGNRFLNFSLLNLQDIPSNVLSLFLLHRFNRRPVGFAYHLTAGICLLVSVGLVASGGQGVELTLATVAQYMGMFSLSGSYIALFTYYMEIYPTSMRAVGTGTANVVITTTDVAAPFLLLWAESNPWAPGVFLGSLCCLASFCIWILPETRHRKLPDTIEEIKAWRRRDPNVAEYIVA